MRPRDFLMFLNGAIETAINRRHDRVLSEDILGAEHAFSENMLKSLAAELRDIFPDSPEFIYSYIGCPMELAIQDAEKLLTDNGIDEQVAQRMQELLLWFGFFGMRLSGSLEIKYSYTTHYEINGLLAPIRSGKAVLVIHPAFRKSLGCSEPSL